MKSTVILLAFISSLALYSFTSHTKDRGCEMMKTYAEMAYLDFKKATQATTLDDAQVLIKKAIEEAMQASAYAVGPQCNCSIASNYALNAVTFGKKAAKADDLAACKKQAKKAMNMALDAMAAAPGCK